MPYLPETPAVVRGALSGSGQVLQPGEFLVVNQVALLGLYLGAAHVVHPVHPMRLKLHKKANYSRIHIVRGEGFSPISHSILNQLSWNSTSIYSIYRLFARVCAWTVVWLKQFSVAHCVACCHWKVCNSCLIKTVQRCSLCGVLLLKRVYRWGDYPENFIEAYCIIRKLVYLKFCE